MTNSSTPTTADYRWGNCVYDFLDYWANPVGEFDPITNARMNPLLIIRHGGGGTLGDYADARNDLFGDAFYFPMWLAGVNPDNPAAHWDVCSVESGQVGHMNFFTGAQTTRFPVSRDLYFSDAVRDCQRAIASIKRLHLVFGFDPRRIIGYGESYGATLLALSQLFPPIGGPGRRNNFIAGVGRPGTFDSTLRGVILGNPQVDCRDGFMDFQNFLGWFGTRQDDAGAEYAALSDDVKAAHSLRAFFESGELDGYPGFFLKNNQQGAHMQPYTNPHDSQQQADLIASMALAGIVQGNGRTGYRSQLLTGTEDQNTLWPNGPNTLALQTYSVRERWMEAQIA